MLNPLHVSLLNIFAGGMVGTLSAELPSCSFQATMSVAVHRCDQHCHGEIADVKAMQDTCAHLIQLLHTDTHSGHI